MRGRKGELRMSGFEPLTVSILVRAIYMEIYYILKTDKPKNRWFMVVSKKIFLYQFMEYDFF
jgi:hypothetical protein